MSKYRTTDLEGLARVFDALGHPHRLRVFVTLAKCCARAGPCCDPADMSRCVGDLGDGLGVAPSTLSHHLKELHASGLIRCERRGQSVLCCIDPATLQRVAEFINNLVPDLETIEGR